MIKVEKAEIELTETTVRQILKAIEDAKDVMTFDEDIEPIDDDIVMTIPQYEKELWNRGIIFISSPASKIRFRVELETNSDTEEGWGYVLENKIGK